MLVLGVATGDYIMIGDHIKVRVLKAGDNVFRLAIEAPKDQLILRKNLYETSNPGVMDRDFSPRKGKKAATR